MTTATFSRNYSFKLLFILDPSTRNQKQGRS